MKKFFLATIFILQLCIFPTISGQQFTPVDFHKTTIPFEIINNLIIIKLNINNNPDTLKFIFDSGIKSTLITNIPNTFQLIYTDKVTIRGLGTGNDIDVSVSPFNTIKINQNLSLINQTLYVFPYDRFELSKQLGTNIHGIIGYDILEKFKVLIDYENKTITLFNPLTFNKYKKFQKWIKLDLQIFNGKPYTELKIIFNDTISKKCKLLVDLGASDALWLFPTAFENIVIKFPQQLYYLGQGLNGDIFGIQTKINKLQISPKYYFDNVVTSIPDYQSVNLPTDYDIHGRNGTVGSEILRRFNILFDYQNQAMYLKRNKYYSQKFHYDLSGIEIQTPFPGLHLYTVYFVHPNSPAYEADIKTDDIILKINQIPTKEMTLNDILLFLNSKENRKIKLTIQRENEVLLKIIRLRNYKITKID